MSAITFVTWDGAGNVGPAVAVAAELAERGHTIDMLGHTSLVGTATAAGVPFTTFPTARSWDAAEGGGPLALLNMMADRAMGRDAVQHARRHHSQVVVVDCLLFGVMKALRDEGIPYIALEHVCDGYIRAAARGPFGLALRAKRLRPLDLIDAASRVMTLTIPELDRGHGEVTHVGPVVRGIPSEANEPAVLISLSTYAYPGMTQVWQRLFDAVDGLPARVVATLGPRIDASELRIPTGIEVHSWLDHATVLPDMSLVVCHGGHGTTVAALAHGLPVVAVPLDPRGDQPYMGTSLEELGAGCRVSKKAKPAKLRSVIETLVVDGPHRASARRLGDSIAALDGRRQGADLVESVVSSLHPVM